MLILLSPAKNLNFDPVDVPATQPALRADVVELAAVTAKLTRAKIKSLMDLSDKLADLNYQRFQAFDPVSTDGKPALFAFNGDVYQGFDAKTLNAKGLTRAQDKIRILSGLYGVLRPLDAIQPYRLEMGIRLKTKRGATLYDFWGDRIARHLNHEVSGHRHPVLVNCASTEYFSAVKCKALTVPVITCHFKEHKSNQLKTIGLFAKRARGMMARFAVDRGIDDPKDLKTFDRAGYAFRSDLSSETDWIFAREASS